MDYPSIYATVVFDLHPKVKNYLDQLNGTGQVDLDDMGYPYLIKCDRQGPNFFTQISRNNRLENFVLNPRKRSDPVISWNNSDGFERPQQKQVVMVKVPDGEMNRKERDRRQVRSSTIESIVENMMGD